MASSHSARYSVEKLDNNNYSVWSYKMKILLKKEKVWSVIVDDEPQEQNDGWDENNEQALSSIALNVDNTQISLIRNAESAKEAWNILKNHHEKPSLSSTVFLLKKLCTLKLAENGDMIQHISEFNGAIDKLAALGESLKDKLQAAMLLVSLPSSYNYLITALENRPEAEFTSELVKSKLIEEHKKRVDSQEIFDNSESVLKVVHDYKKSNNNKQTCYFCKKTGHIRPECRKFARWLERQKLKEESAKHVMEDEVDFSNMAVHRTSECCLYGSVENKEKSWIIDSGASSHMTNSKEFFINFNENTKGSVTLADNLSILKVRGSGKVILNCEFNGNKSLTLNLSNVLYVPDLASSLISVKKLIKDGYTVKFNKWEECIIRKEKDVQGVAYLSPDLFELRLVNKAFATLDNTHIQTHSHKHNELCQHSWHRRFGHRNIQAMQYLYKKDMALNFEIKDCGIDESCECCIKGKVTRKQFPKLSENKSSEILEIVHTDICGPIKQKTPRGNRYFLTIIDDFSRYCYLYLLKSKSEAELKIKQFIEFTISSYNKKPKIIRSDRGREYVNNNLELYLKNQGIRVQYTAPYTPEQNGVAERKNRSLVEMTGCMIIDAGMDKIYWGEAILTANWLQNRLPTRIIDTTPFEKWHKKKPDLNGLQIFGSIAYVHIPKEKRLKLDDKAEKLIFVGYSEESKAYRLLDTKTSRIRISRDVKFESIERKVFHPKLQINFNKQDSENEVVIYSENFNKSKNLSKKDENLLLSDSSILSFESAINNSLGNISINENSCQSSNEKSSENLIDK